ncbi:polysaccharide deacetylase family protein, partial [Rhizobium leguminosarum]|uniref:polysaccharide deacetylase family protein n=1 Tax=Rhizobium leguminosarum TaxID=384 RepID=UPI003F95FFB9
AGPDLATRSLTYEHANLSSLSFDAAMAEVIKGELAVTKATGTDVSFFRFPYLAESNRLSAAIAMRDMVVMDVDIDSKDYFTAT